MNYCFNCGTQLGSDDKFCPDCGAKLAETANKPASSEPRRGIVFTNVAALAAKFDVPASKVRTIVERYIERLAKANVYYTLIDASNYTAGGSDRAVSLSPADTWLKHTAILADYMASGAGSGSKPTYLFILGSGDVIPMPVVDHFYSSDDFPDRDIETDLPYGWLAGSKTEAMLRSTELFRYAPNFHVGRLPLGTDSRLGDLEDYLERAASLAADGLRVNRAYGQSDINWRELSLLVTGGTAEPLFPDAARRTDSNLCFKGLYTTPLVETSNVDGVFTTNADIYYFNMHGSNAPSSPGFVGQYPNDGPYVNGMSPAQIARAEHDNIFVTEACYGGRFTGFSAPYSMALTALRHRTAIYLGASRIAWGMTDGILNGHQNVNLSSGDRMCHVFMLAMQAGLTAGEAVYLARRSFFSYSLKISPIGLSSIVEFNLLGDPTLFSHWVNSEKGDSGADPVKMEPFLARDSRSGFSVEKIETAGLLSAVRGLVDKNIAAIRKTLAAYMNENFGLPAEALMGISKVSYRSGEQEYMFFYGRGEGDHRKFYLVETDPTGNISTILISK